MVTQLAEPQWAIGSTAHALFKQQPSMQAWDRRDVVMMLANMIHGNPWAHEGPVCMLFNVITNAAIYKSIIYIFMGYRSDLTAVLGGILYRTSQNYTFLYQLMPFIGRCGRLTIQQIQWVLSDERWVKRQLPHVGLSTHQMAWRSSQQVGRKTYPELRWILHIDAFFIKEDKRNLLVPVKPIWFRYLREKCRW